MPPLISTLLAQRGIQTPENVANFLHPSLKQLPKPTGMAGLPEALALLARGLTEKTTVLVYGDYDADGITATALLLSFFREIGLPCCFYIPDRLTEGYGLSSEALQRLRISPDLTDCREPILLTVDCGISCHDEIKEAQRLGFKVIITDHHQPPQIIPEADAVINPQVQECLFPYKDLAGVGVAFYLVVALRSQLLKNKYWPEGKEPNLKKYLDLVAIGTIADMVSLTGANRILVKAGLEVMAENPRPGIKALMEQADIATHTINSGHIGFQIAPRINAAGRVGNPREAVELLIGTKPDKAIAIARELESANRYRKELSEEIFQEAAALAEKSLENGNKTLVLAKKGWHLGVCGLVASRIAKKYYRPTVVMVPGDDGVARGSVRSIDEINILEIIEDCSDVLQRYGGHKAAAGLTLRNEAIATFAERFEAALTRKLNGVRLQPTILADLRATMDEIMDIKFLEYYEKMEPFGQGNSEPIFCNASKSLTISAARIIGRDSLRFQIDGKNGGVAGVAFGMAHLLPAVKEGAVTMLFKITKNSFRGTTKWEVRAEDIKSDT